MVLKGENKHTQFAERLNSAFDRIGVPKKGAGRQLAVAKMFGVSQKGARKWLEGESIPRIEKLKQIADKVHLTIEYLLTGKGAMETSIGTMDGNVAHITHKNGQPVALVQVPVISWTTAGDWCGVVDPFPVGAAEDFVQTTMNISNRSYALVIHGDSMEPVIPDGATIIIDPEREYKNLSIVIARQENSSEATCKRLIIDGDQKYLRPENNRYPIMNLKADAEICGVVVQVVMSLVEG